jgi:hypothetical protein
MQTRFLTLALWLSLPIFWAPCGWGQCAPPSYGCARTDTSVITLPNPLPNWGG